MYIKIVEWPQLILVCINMKPQLNTIFNNIGTTLNLFYVGILYIELKNNFYYVKLKNFKLFILYKYLKKSKKPFCWNDLILKHDRQNKS